MRFPKTVLTHYEDRALRAIAIRRVPQMLVLYDSDTGIVAGYVNLN